jgi:cytochrome P450 family 150 subfamily A5
MAGSELATIDFFRDKAVAQDPYAYYDAVRDQGPVWREPNRDVVMISGYDEAIAVYHDQATFSSCNTVAGPFFSFSVPLEGDDITAIIEAHRDELPFSDQLPSFDPPKHTDHRALLMRLITPKRLKENEEFMWRLADQTFDEFFPRGECEFVGEYALPFTLLVVADLLGVPEDDRDKFRAKLLNKKRTEAMSHAPLEYLYEQFTVYIEDRRRAPRDDVMTGLATATFPDGTLPAVDDVMRIAANLFSAGGETTARLLSTSFRILGDRPDLQRMLRDEPATIPAFIEEALRLESPIKGEFRLSRVPVTVGGIDLPAGTTVFVMNGAANRDPRQFEDPHEFRLDRANGRQHIGFGHGIHSCAGAPLARAETRITIERFLARTREITISEVAHGPIDARRYAYDPTYMLRGLRELHLEFTPVG